MSELINDGFPFTVAQGRDLGFSPGELRRMYAQGRVRREFRGVYVDVRVPDSRRGRLRAIRLVTPDNAVVCDQTAAWVMGLDVFAPGARHDFEPAMVVHSHGIGGGAGQAGEDAAFTFFVVYGSVKHLVDLDAVQVEERAYPLLTSAEINGAIKDRLRRKLLAD